MFTFRVLPPSDATLSLLASSSRLPNLVTTSTVFQSSFLPGTCVHLAAILVPLLRPGRLPKEVGPREECKQNTLRLKLSNCAVPERGPFSSICRTLDALAISQNLRRSAGGRSRPQQVDRIKSVQGCAAKIYFSMQKRNGRGANRLDKSRPRGEEGQGAHGWQHWPKYRRSPLANRCCLPACLVWIKWRRRAWFPAEV